MISVGIDLAGKGRNPTGFAIIKTERASSEEQVIEVETKIAWDVEKKGEVFLPLIDLIIVKEVYFDEDILREIPADADIIAIDAPFSFPGEGYYRESDTELKRNGFKPLSPKFPTMQLLVRRAIKIVSELRKNFNVIEVFPRASEKILCLDQKFVEGRVGRELSDHEYDAILAAITGKMHLEGKTKTYGKEVDDQIVVPLV